MERLVKGLEAVVLGIPFSKSMEWGSGGLRFGRPLHRVSALFGGQVIATNVGPLAVGNSTVGHRLADAPHFSFDSAEAWQRGLVDRRVEPDVDVRRSLIQVLLDQATEQLGAEPIDEPELLGEVTQLVEWPTLVIGTFDADLLELPPKLLIQAMKVHQRYFPVHRDGELLNHFVVISNNPWGDGALIAVAGVHAWSPMYRVAALGSIATHPDARGQGLGALTTSAVLRALPTGTSVGLNVHEQNTVAKRLYERLGFREATRYGEWSAATP